MFNCITLHARVLETRQKSLIVQLPVGSVAAEQVKNNSLIHVKCSQVIYILILTANFSSESAAEWSNDEG